MRFCLIVIFLTLILSVTEGTEQEKIIASNETFFDGELDRARIALIESLKNHILRKLGINATTIPANDTEIPSVADPDEVIAPRKLFLGDQPASPTRTSRPTSLVFVEPTCNQNGRTDRGTTDFILRLHYDLSTIPKLHSIQSVLLSFHKVKVTSNNTKIFCPEIVSNFYSEEEEKLRINLYHITGFSSDGKAKRELIDSRLDNFDREGEVVFDISHFLSVQFRRSNEFDIALEFQDLFGRYIRTARVIRPKNCKESTCSTWKCGAGLQVWVYENLSSRSRRSKRSSEGAANTENCDTSESCCLRSLNLNLEDAGLEWILTPKNLSLNFCFGFCRREMNNCLPSKFNNVTIAYLGNQNKIARKNFQVNATECRCSSNTIPRIAQNVLSVDLDRD